MRPVCRRSAVQSVSPWRISRTRSATTAHRTRRCRPRQVVPRVPPVPIDPLAVFGRGAIVADGRPRPGAVGRRRIGDDRPHRRSPRRRPSSSGCTGAGLPASRSSSTCSSTLQRFGSHRRSPANPGRTRRRPNRGSIACTSWCGRTTTTAEVTVRRCGGGRARPTDCCPEVRSSSSSRRATSLPVGDVRARRRIARSGSTAGRASRGTRPRSGRRRPRRVGRGRPGGRRCPPSQPRRRARRRPARRRRPSRAARRGSSPRPGRARPACSPSGCATSSSTAATSRESVLAVAYNKEAERELTARTAAFRPHVRTLNALGLWVLREHRGSQPHGHRRTGGAQARRLVAARASPAAGERRPDRAVPGSAGGDPPRPSRPGRGRGDRGTTSTGSASCSPATAPRSATAASSTSTSRSMRRSRRSSPTARSAPRCSVAAGTSSSTSSRTSRRPTSC